METRPETAPIAAIILAAGSSTRMGRPKQLLPIDDQPMVRHVVEAVAAAGLDQVIVVTGAHAGAVEAALADFAVDLVFNEHWAQGMSGSMHTGLRALRPEIQAALLVLGDQPAVTTGLLQSLVVGYRDTGAHIVAPVYRGQRGNPVLFARALFSELLAVQGDRGGRELLKRHRDQVYQVEVGDPAVLIDIDSPQDYDELIGVAG